MTIDLKIGSLQNRFTCFVLERCVSERKTGVTDCRVCLPACLLWKAPTSPRRFRNPHGVVADPTGAVVPNAKIVLTDAVSGSARDTVADGDGY